MGSRGKVAALSTAVVAFAVQQTSIVPAVHDVERALGGSPEWSSWLVTVYLMVATVATMAMGRLGDLHGRRRLLLIGLGLFAVGSVGAALSPDLAVLIGCRAVQGVGGSVYPLALALARDSVPRDRATATISLLTGGFGAGTAIGFAGGGLLAQYVSWRAIFAVGGILVLLAAWLVARCVPEPADRASGRFDLAGTVLVGVAAIALLGGITLATSAGWAAPVTIGLLVAAAVAALGWVRHERRTEDPLVDLGILGERPVAVANLATIGLGWALFGSYLLVPQFARAQPGHAGYGLAAQSALVGLLLLPLALAQTVAGPVAGRLNARFPARVVCGAGLLLVAAGIGVLALTRTSALSTAVGTLLLGAGAGGALQAGSAVATEEVAPDVAAVSASVNSTVRRLAGGLGGQVSTLLLAATVSTGFTGYAISYLIAAVLCVLGAATVFLVRSQRTPAPQRTSPGP